MQPRLHLPRSLPLALLPALMLLACRPAPPPADPAAKAAGLGFDPAEIDTTIRPQDDFWRHVNGHWLARQEIPADLPGYGVFYALQERTDADLRRLLEGPAEAQLRDLYRSFMDEAGIEQAGLAPLAADLEAIDALRDHGDVIAWFGQALADGIQVPVTYYIESAADDPTRNLPYFFQDGLGLPDRDYYLLNTPALASVRNAYAAHIERMYALAGWPGGAAAARTIMATERRLAEHHWTAAESENLGRIFRNRFTLAAAVRHAPGFDWPLFLARAGFGTPQDVVLAQEDYFAILGRIVAETSVADWRTYLRFKTLKRYASLLNRAIVAEDFAFEGTVLKGQPENRPRWRRGVALVSHELPDLLGQAYVARHFSAASRRRVEAIVDNLEAEFAAGIDAAAWMSAATRREARGKLARFTRKIGFPDQWRSYDGVVIRPDDLVGNARRTRQFTHRYEVGKIARPVDRSEWFIPPQTVNAYYYPTYNEIVFPAAILQPPYFDPEADDAYNYGSIGATIGHEFSHGFDDQGRLFDGDGRLRDWWTPADAAEYTARTRRLVTQFSTYRPLPDVAINGDLTLGENIADLVGVVMAERAYHRSLNGRPAPNLKGYTGEQRFFIGYALSFRGKERPEKLRAQLLSDPHAPDEFRVQGILRNVPEFYAAFSVGPGDGMYLPPEQRAMIW